MLFASGQAWSAGPLHPHHTVAGYVVPYRTVQCWAGRGGFGCSVTVYLSQVSALSQVNYDLRYSLSNGEKSLLGSRAVWTWLTMVPCWRSYEQRTLGWDNIILPETKAVRQECTYVCVYSGGGAELTRERDGGRKKESLLQWGRSNGDIESAEIKNGLYSAVLQSGPHPLRRNGDKDDMTSAESSEAPAQKLTQISGSWKPRSKLDLRLSDYVDSWRSQRPTATRWTLVHSCCTNTVKLR